MSVRQRGDAFEVRWTLGGRKRSRTFTQRADAEAFDAKVMRQKRLKRAAFALYSIEQSDLGEQVYVVRGGESVKIGVSVQPLERLAALQTASPVPLSVVWRIACPNARKLERALHRRYRAHRTHGEWFAAAPVLSDLEALSQLGQFNLVAAPENGGRTEDAVATIESAA